MTQDLDALVRRQPAGPVGEASGGLLEFPLQTAHIVEGNVGDWGAVEGLSDQHDHSPAGLLAPA
jgi:hypothetical protein